MLTDRHMARLLDNDGFEINLYLTIENSSFNTEAEKYHYSVEFETTYGSYIKREYEVERTIGDNMPSMVMSGVDESTHIVYAPRWYEGPTDEIGGNIADYPNSNQIVATRVTNIETILSDIWTENIGIGSNGVTFRATRNTWTNNAHLTIRADFPIFLCNLIDITDNINLRTEYDNTNDCILYRTQVLGGNYTNIDKAINYDDSAIGSIATNKVYSIRNYFKANGTITQTKGYDFRIQPNSKIYFVLTNQIEGDSSPNMILHITESPWLQKPANAPDSAYLTTTVLDSDYWWGDWQDSDAGITYIGYGSTNIPIFDSAEKGQAYADGDIGEDASINSGSTSIRTSTIGDSLQGTDIPTVNLSTSGVGTYIYALSETQIKNLMSNYLYVTDSNLLNNISEGLWLWGNNPIDFFIDCYYIPFDITNFYTTNNADMKFGTYRFESSQGWATFPVVQETNGQRLTLFNTTFEGIYGDWRDYSQFEYDLFLPFYGFFKLDLYKYLNHTVRCEMMFDVTTHNLRYYLFVDDVITDRIDSSVGINLPLMSSDYVNKAKSDRQARRESDRTAYRAMGAFLTGGLAVAGGIASGNASYAVNGGTSAITSVIDAKYNLDALADKVNENATQSVEGAYSSSMNIYDIRYAYLRITESELVIPDKLNQLYGYPSYYMGSASALSGYCEISDIRIKSFTGTIEELNALKGALREGVIL